MWLNAVDVPNVAGTRPDRPAYFRCRCDELIATTEKTNVTERKSPRRIPKRLVQEPLAVLAGYEASRQGKPGHAHLEKWGYCRRSTRRTFERGQKGWAPPKAPFCSVAVMIRRREVRASFINYCNESERDWTAQDCHRVEKSKTSQVSRSCCWRSERDLTSVVRHWVMGSDRPR